jgi:AcrR family transcriptional regulator
MSPSARPSKSDVITDFRRTQILDAARDSFAKHGMSGTTVHGIARSAGVAKGTVYLYYKSKEEILKQVLDEDVAQLHATTVQAIGEPGSIEEKLRRFLTGALRFFDEKRDFFEQCHFEMGADVRRKATQKLEVVFTAQVEAWRHALTEARQARQVGKIDIGASALMIVALAGGLAKQRLRGWATGPIDEIAAEASATLWKGLAAR